MLQKITISVMVFLFLLASSPLLAQGDKAQNDEKKRAVKIYLTTLPTNFYFNRNTIEPLKSTDFSFDKLGVPAFGYAWQMSKRGFSEVSLSFFYDEDEAIDELFFFLTSIPSPTTNIIVIDGFKQQEAYFSLYYESYWEILQKEKWQIALGGSASIDFATMQEIRATATFFSITYQSLGTRFSIVPHFSYRFKRFALEMNFPTTFARLSFNKIREDNPAVIEAERTVTNKQFDFLKYGGTYQLRAGLVFFL